MYWSETVPSLCNILAAFFTNIQTLFRRTVIREDVQRHKSQGTGRRLTTLYVKTDLAVSQDAHQTNQAIPVSDGFYSLCNETTSHADHHFASLSWKEMLPSFLNLEKGLRALVSAYSLATNLLCNFIVLHNILEFSSHKEIHKMKQPLM